MKVLITNAIELLKDLITIESFSFNEDKSADRIENWFKSYDIDFIRNNNNIYAFNKCFDYSKPTYLYFFIYAVIQVQIIIYFLKKR